MAHPRKSVPPGQATFTQAAIDAGGGPAAVARALTVRLGYLTSRQTVHNWYQRGRLPFLNHGDYARALADICAEHGAGITLDDLLGEVLVPASRLPR